MGQLGHGSQQVKSSARVTWWWGMITMDDLLSVYHGDANAASTSAQAPTAWRAVWYLSRAVSLAAWIMSWGRSNVPLDLHRLPVEVSTLHQASL